MQAVQKILSQSGTVGSPRWCWVTFHIKLYLTCNIRKRNMVSKFPLEFQCGFWKPSRIITLWQHDTALHQAVYGGDSLQMWRVDANIFNNQCQTAKKGWLSILGVGWQKTRMLHIFYCAICT